MAYNATNMDYMEVQNSVLFEGIDVTDKSRILGAALATAVSRKLPIAPPESKSAEAHYMSTHAVSVLETISEFNEKILIDTFVAKELVRNLYLIRFAAAYPECCVAAESPYDFFCTYSDVHMRIDQETYNFLAKYKKIILILSNRIIELLCK